MSDSNIKITQTVPFLAVTDMERSIAFYVDGLGFEIQNKWIDDGKLRWCWLQHGDGALMLQEFRTEGHDSFVPTGKLGEGLTLYFMREDAKDAHREITKCGHLEAAQWLMQKIPDINAQNPVGETPLDQAIGRKHTDVANWLKSIGAQKSK